jgi:hypothetical protein
MKTLLTALLVASSFAISTTTATASNAVIVIPFEKHQVGPGHYVGTTADGGTIDMQLSNSSVTGDVQHFTATVQLVFPDRSMTATLDGQFNFITLETVLNGYVVDGWLAGARVHEAGQLVGSDPLTFAGTMTVMPASAD